MSALEAKLAGLRGRLFRLWVTRSLLTAAAWWLSLMLAAVLVDVASGLPYRLRISWSLLIFALSAGWFVREAFFSAVQAISSMGFAMFLERRYPDLKDLLVTALQFQRSGPGDAAFNSPEMVQVVLSQAQGVASQIREDETLRLARASRYAVACASFLLLGAGGAFASARFKQGLKRTVLDVPFPPRTFYRVEQPENPDVKIARGERCAVKIVPRKGSFRPARAAIEHRFTRMAGSGWNADRMNRFEDGSFSWEFEAVSDPLTFRMVADDWTSPEYRLDVAERPRFEMLELTVTPPAYTGLAAYVQVAKGAAKGHGAGGDVHGVAGTSVRFSARATKPLARAAIVFGEQPQEIACQGNGFSGEFSLTENQVYHFEIQDAEGLSEEQPTRYNLRIVPDRLPQVRITAPDESSLLVTRYAQFQVGVSAQDDFGIRAVRLVMNTKTESDDAWSEVHSFILEPSPPGQKQCEGVFDFSMDQVQASPGLKIRYRAEASDFRAPDKGSSSQEYRCHVEEESVVQNELLRRLKDLGADTVRTREQQLAAQTLTSSVLDQKDANAAALRLADAIAAQHRILEEVTKRWENLTRKVRWYFGINQFQLSPDPFVVKKEKEMADLLGQVDRHFQELLSLNGGKEFGYVGLAEQALLNSRSEAGIDPEKLHKAQEAQRVVSDKLEEIVLLLQKETDLTKLVADWTKIREDLRRVSQ